MSVLNLGRKDATQQSLENIAQRLGFLRKWTTYSLVNRDSMKAVLIVNQSDLGANLSELLNGIKVLVIDPEGLPWEILSLALAHLTGVYQLDCVPILIHPSTYNDVVHVPCEKKYQLWILNTLQNQSEFVDYMQKRFKMTYE